MDELERKAQKMIDTFDRDDEFSFEIIDIDSEVGAGLLPTQKLPSKAVKIISKSFKKTNWKSCFEITQYR